MGNVFLIAEQKDGNIKRVSLEVLSELCRQGIATTAVEVLKAGRVCRGTRYLLGQT